MKRRISVATALCALLVLAGCSKSRKQQQSEQEAQNEAPRMEVKVVHPRVDNVEIREDFTANVEAYVVNNIAPQTPNRISRMLVEVGQNVRRGQLLAVLDDSQLAQQKLRLDNTKADLDRLQVLYDVGGIAKSQFEAQQVAYDVALAAYKNLAENTRLMSPISGVVSKRNYDSGDMYTPGMPIFVIEQIEPLKLKVNMSESYFAKVKPGQEMDVRLDVFGDELFKAKVSLIAPTIDPKTRTFEVEMQLPNRDRRIRPGMYAHVSALIDQVEAMLIPDVSVLTLPGTNDHYVFVAEQGKAVRKEVRVGKVLGDEYIILEGLAPSDQVICTGLSELRAGRAIALVEQ